jgi:hypothetical protein
MKLDWFAGKGVSVGDRAVVHDVTNNGKQVSDHDPNSRDGAHMNLRIDVSFREKENLKS